MADHSKQPVVMIVDDDQEDVYLAKRAFKAYRKDINLVSVCSGAQLFDYLAGKGDYQNADRAMPNVILLDINMPELNGFEILSVLRNNTDYAHIPIIMLTTSDAEEDVKKAYDLGASAYICKSVNADEMKKITMGICVFWLELVKVPRVA